MTKNHQRGFLTWKTPGRVPHIRLEHDVIDRMTVDVMRGFGVTRRRGTEVGGVLLGKINGGDESTLSIYDYEVVPCEYSQGPSYVLSARDLVGFREVISRWRREISPDQYVVGYFRSHTRDGLHLDETDSRLFHEYLNNPLAVALAVRPYATRSCEAGFFLQSEGKLETDGSPLEFQFVRSESAVAKTAERVQPLARPSSASPIAARKKVEDDNEEEEQANRAVLDVAQRTLDFTPPRTEPPREPERPKPNTDRPAPAMFGSYQPQPESTWRTRILWVAYTMAVFGFGSVVGYEYGGGQLQPVRTPVGNAPASAGRSAADPYTVQLSAVQQDQSVLVKWNRESDAVKNALNGVLTITEGDATKQVKLDFPELRNGTILYHKVGQQVAFKLDLYFKESRMFTESLNIQFSEK